MKPKIEELLFINKKCEHDLENFCPLVRLNQEILENLIRNELKDKYYPEFVKYFKSNLNDCQLKSAKNSQRSVDARIKGNALFAKNVHNIAIHKEIWELYSLSIALAPIRSKELVLAYESRSNLLLHFKQYEDCLKDIDRALSITNFDPLKVKLLCRKMTCFVAMNKDVEEKEDLWDILECSFEKTDGAFKNENFLKMIKQAKNDVCIEPNKLVKDERECSTFCDTFSNIVLEKGHLMATRDIQAGEVVTVTKPNITSVNPDKFYAYCCHCLSFMWAGVPCDECSSSMYCSEECKEKAWEQYHILECKVNPHISQLDFCHSIYYDLAVSIKIFLTGVREFGSISKLLDKVREVEQDQDDAKFVKVDNIHESKFLDIYTLPNKLNSDSCTLSNLVKITCFLMAYLTQILNEIFEKEVGTMRGKVLARDDDFVHSTYIMLNIMIMCGLYSKLPVISKCVPYQCPKYESSNECLKKRCCSPGIVFHFLTGLMDRSCNPNVSVCQTRDGKLIYFCVQPIKKMERISRTLTVPFYLRDRMSRLQTVPGVQKQSLYELCQCIACEKNWPPIILQTIKLQSKFYRRTSIAQTDGTELTQKYLSRFAATGDPAKYFSEYDADEFQELVKDTNTVVSICGQPSFASTWMMMTLWNTYENMYADVPMLLHIPKDC